MRKMVQKTIKAGKLVKAAGSVSVKLTLMRRALRKEEFTGQDEEGRIAVTVNGVPELVRVTCNEPNPTEAEIAQAIDQALRQAGAAFKQRTNDILKEAPPSVGAFLGVEDLESEADLKVSA